MKCKAGLKWVDQKIIDEIIACGNYYVKSVQIELSPNTEKYGPEITKYLDTFHAVTSK